MPVAQSGSALSRQPSESLSAPSPHSSCELPSTVRLDDQSVAGLEVVRSISELYRMYGVETQVLSASIRSVQRAVRSWYNGAKVVTMPPKYFWEMYNHILTKDGLDKFQKDWDAANKEHR